MDKPFIHEDVRAEYVESYVWYHERGSHIAEVFERGVEHTLESLQNSPDRWPVYVGRWRGILLRRFPFDLVTKLQLGNVPALQAPACGDAKRELFGIISVFPAIHLNCSVDRFTRGGW